MRIKHHTLHGLSLLEFVLVLVAIGFLVVGGIHLLSVQVEQNKIRKAADQIEGWLLAAQSYYRSQVKAGATDKWPLNDNDPNASNKDNNHGLAALYPFVADQTTADKFISTNTTDPWGNAYVVQPGNYTTASSPYEHAYQPAYIPNSTSAINPSSFNFFTLQAKIKGLKRALAVASRLPAAQIYRDLDTQKIVPIDGYYYLNATIPPPPIVKSELHHMLIANLGVVKTKDNGAYNGYNYTKEGFVTDTNQANSRRYFIQPEHGGTVLTKNEIDKYGAVFIRKPTCPTNMEPHLQASIAGFGILGGYTTQYNTSATRKPTEAPPNGGNLANPPYFLFSTSPVPSNQGNTSTLTQDQLLSISDQTFFPDFLLNSDTATTSNSMFYMGKNAPIAQSRLLGAIIGAHIRESDLQYYIRQDGTVDQAIRGWYLWLDITANMMMHPNYSNVPQVIKDCALNINTISNGFPYFEWFPGDNRYSYISQYANVNTTAGSSYYGTCNGASQGCHMAPADLIINSGLPLYAPSTCHFHSGYIAYLTSCVPTQTVAGDTDSFGNPQTLIQEYGLDQAQTQLQYKE